MLAGMEFGVLFFDSSFGKYSQILQLTWRYLTDTEAAQTLRRIGGLSAPRSSLFFDAISASYVHQRIVPCRVCLFLPGFEALNRKYKEGVSKSIVFFCKVESVGLTSQHVRWVRVLILSV